MGLEHISEEHFGHTSLRPNLTSPHFTSEPHDHQSASCPQVVEHTDNPASYLGVLPSTPNSALMLIKLPVSLWDSLPEHPTYRKIDFVRAGYLLVGSLDQRLFL